MKHKITSPPENNKKEHKEANTLPELHDQEVNGENNLDKETSSNMKNSRKVVGSYPQHRSLLLRQLQLSHHS